VVVEPMEVGPMGTMVIAADPQGNAFGLWQSGQHTGYRVFNEHGSLVCSEAAVDDPAAAREFHTAVFGFIWAEVPGAEGYQTFAIGDRMLGSLGGHQPGSPKGWTACFAVDSTDEAVATVECGGGKATMAPMDTEYGRFAVVEDPWVPRSRSCRSPRACRSRGAEEGPSRIPSHAAGCRGRGRAGAAGARRPGGAELSRGSARRCARGAAGRPGGGRRPWPRGRRPSRRARR
jgi:predicted enzyme related to lactoylglutathione lyase